MKQIHYFIVWRRISELRNLGKNIAYISFCVSVKSSIESQWPENYSLKRIPLWVYLCFTKHLFLQACSAFYPCSLCLPTSLSHLYLVVVCTPRASVLLPCWGVIVILWTMWRSRNHKWKMGSLSSWDLTHFSRILSSCIHSPTINTTSFFTNAVQKFALFVYATFSLSITLLFASRWVL